MPRSYDRADDEKTARLYRDGLTTYEVAARFGVSPTPVRAALRRMGVEMRPGGRRLAWSGSPAQREQAAALYRDGTPVRTIARRMRCRTSHITEALEAAGVERRPHGTAIRALTDDQVREAVSAYEAGATTRDLAARYETTTATVRSYLNGQGVTLRPAAPPVIFDPEQAAEVARRYQAGEIQREIAASLGVSRAAVSSALRRQGVPANAPRMQGEQHGSWKGGRVINSHGYVEVKIPADARHLVPRPKGGGYVLEHRLVMARVLGRPLLDTETVHHVNGDKQDNRPGNLQVRHGRHGKGSVFRCLDCGSRNVTAIQLP